MVGTTKYYGREIKIERRGESQSRVE